MCPLCHDDYFTIFVVEGAACMSGLLAPDGCSTVRTPNPEK
jgi:hypothetical protein